MSLLAESNSVKKVNMKEKLPLSLRIKRIVYIVLIVLGVGFGIQLVYNFVGNEAIKVKTMYTNIDNQRVDFNVKGAGDYTVIFDGPIGTNMYEWNETLNQIENLGVKTFVYNRSGYGKSTIENRETPKEEAEKLSTVLKKAAIGGKYILVGEGYGSLVLTNFAKLHPEKVKGVVLINPINEKDKAKYHNFKDLISLCGEKIQEVGANFTFTWLLDKVGLATNYPKFEKSLTEENEKDQYNWLKNQAPYRKAIYNENKNLYEMDSNSQTAGMFDKVPLYIISNIKDNPLKDLGSKDLTTEYYVDYNGDSFATTNSKDVGNSITKVVDQAIRIEARNQENKSK